MTSRNLLHRNKLGAFRGWMLSQDYRLINPPRGGPRHPYEVLRMELYDPCGNHPHVVIYRNDRNDYLTVSSDDLPLVENWLVDRRRKTARGKRFLKLVSG